MPTDLKKGLEVYGSRDALALKLGVSPQTVWRWEHSQPIPEPERRLLRRIIEEAVAK